MSTNEYADIRAFEQQLERAETAIYIVGPTVAQWRETDAVVPVLYDTLLAEIEETKALLKESARSAAKFASLGAAGDQSARDAHLAVMGRLARKLFRIARLKAALEREQTFFESDAKTLIRVGDDGVTVVGDVQSKPQKKTTQKAAKKSR